MVGLLDVPQQVPRAEIDDGTPREVTLAPSVAPEEVIEADVGVVTVGTEVHILATVPEVVAAGDVG